MLRTFSSILLAALALGATPARAELQVPFERHRLANGLTVILYEDHTVPQVAVNLMYKVGSKDERVRRTGFAHLFEHLMFMGSKNVPNGEFDRLMESRGGQNNATTSEDRTSYFEFGPSAILETLLYLEAERLATLPDAMSPKKVDIQREVVKDERRQSYENRPYGGVELALPEMLYPVGHPYHHTVIGSHADLSAARVGDVVQFFKSYYLPSNASLVVAGDIDPKAALALVDKWFAWMPRAPEPEHASAAPVRLSKDVRRTLSDRVELDQVTLAWHSPAAFAPGDASCDLLAALLGGGHSSRLEQRLIFERKLASELHVEQRGLLLGGQFVITATAAPGHHAAELEAALRTEIAALADGREPATQAELVRARAFVETHRLAELDGLVPLAEALNEYELRFGDPGQLERAHLRRYAALTIGDLAWQAWSTLAQPSATIVVVPQAAAAKKEVAHAR